MVWLPFNQVAVSSMTRVDASRDELPDAPAPVAVTPLARLVSRKPVPQHAPLKFRRMLPVSANIDGLSSGEKNVAPPDPPKRNSLTRLVVNVDRSDSEVVHRVDCWLPVIGMPGNGGCALLVVSGVELM